MDVRTSWRKALEEGKSERKDHDGLSCVVTPVSQVQERTFSPVFSLSASEVKMNPASCSPLPLKQGHSLQSTVSWDSSQLDALNQSSSSLIHFSIAHETFPDEHEDDSINCSGSLNDRLSHIYPEADGALKVTSQHFNDSSSGMIMDTQANLPPVLHTSPVLGNCKEKVFSLDLDHLESFMSPLRDLAQPDLVTFSPMDEL